MQQATCAHSGADTATSPGNSHDISTPSRRSILGALAAVPAMAISAVPADANGTAYEWDAALRDLAKVEHRLAIAKVDDDAARAAKAADKPDTSNVDWEGLAGVLPSLKANYHLIDIDAVRADTERHIAHGYWRHNPGHPLRRLAALDQLEAHRAAVAEHDRRHASRSTVAADRYDAAITHAYLAEKRLIDMPAPHAAALLWKIERLINDEGDGCTASWSIDYVEPMLADARRLLRASA